MPQRPENCELCAADRFTHWYHEDETCWVADCEVCMVPMVVWKRHGTEPPDEDLAHMKASLAASADERFEGAAWQFDDNMRQIPDHYHAHARDKNWFAKRGTRRLSRYTEVGSPRVER